MVQNISNQTQNGYGSVNRIGMTNNGRVVYQVTDATGQASGKVSVAMNDSDKFERSYNAMLNSAPKLQQYAQKTSPAQMEKKQKMAKWFVGGGALLGGIWPALKVKGGGGVLGFLKVAGVTLLGTGAGAMLGMFAASKLVTPPGAKEFAAATQTISKLDIQPVQE